MADYLTVWKTREVTIGLGFIDGNVIMERTRGYKNKKKKVTMTYDNFSSLVQCVVHATTDQPSRQLENRQPVGMIDGGCGDLLVEWSPYLYDSCNALMIRGGSGNCVAVEQKNIRSFAFWLTQQLIPINELGEYQEAK